MFIRGCVSEEGLCLPKIFAGRSLQLRENPVPDIEIAVYFEKCTCKDKYRKLAFVTVLPLKRSRQNSFFDKAQKVLMEHENSRKLAKRAIELRMI